MSKNKNIVEKNNDGNKKKIIIACVAFVVIVAGVLTFVFKDKLFGSNNATGDITTENSTITYNVADDDLFMTVGDVEVNGSVFNFFKKMYGSQADDKSIAEVVEQTARAIAVGKAMNIDIEERLAAYLKEIEDKYGNLDEFKKNQKISDDVFDFLTQSDVYMEKLKEASGVAEITDETIDEYFKTHYWRAKHLLLMTQDQSTGQAYDEAKKQEIKEKIDGLLKRAEDGEDFDALIKEYNEDPGMESNPDGYVFTDGEMVPEFQDAAENGEVGKYKLVETSYGYHIVKKLALDETQELYNKFLADKKEAIKSKLDQSDINDFILTKVGELGITTTINQ